MTLKAEATSPSLTVSTDWLCRFASHVLHATVDDLRSVSIAALTAAVKASCTVVLFLGDLICFLCCSALYLLIAVCVADDETVRSQWVVHELKTAQANQIPIITVIDIVSVSCLCYLTGTTTLTYDSSSNAEYVQPARTYRAISSTGL